MQALGRRTCKGCWNEHQNWSMQPGTKLNSLGSEPSRGRTQPPKIDGDLFYDKARQDNIQRHTDQESEDTEETFCASSIILKRYSQWSIIRPLLVIISCMSGCLFLSVHATVRQILAGNVPTTYLQKICLFSDLSKGKLYIKRWQTWSRLSSLSRQWCNQQWTSGALNPFLWVQRGSEPARRRREWRMLPGCLSDSSSSLCLHPCWQHSSTILIKVWCLLN